MIELHGQIKLQRLHGHINVVPSESAGGGLLQAKTAYPSHSEQIIAPDEDFYGLVSVTVKPVPRLPFCEVTISTPSGIEYYYNHEQLPEIPADIMAEYPYIVIMRSLVYTRIYACIEKPYFDGQGSETIRVRLPNKYVRYSYDASVNAWVYDSSGNSTYFSVHGDGNWCVWWSNNNVPNGSADSAETYFPATEPKAEQPANATHFYYNGVRLPAIPAAVLAEYPYAWIRNNTRTGNYDLLLSAVLWYLKDENTLAKNTLTTKWYQIAIASADTAQAWTATSDYDSKTWENESDRRIMWANHNIPNGSADATDIYYYGTLAVPNPL